MDIHTLNSAEIKEFGSLYQEKLKQEYELIDLYNTLESNYKKRKNVKNMSKKRLAEMWATFVDTREKKIEAEMEAARSERILEKLQERGDELGVLIEVGWGRVDQKIPY
ncbi:unnamed protein product [Caenorhabditis brenneri]